MSDETLGSFVPGEDWQPSAAHAFPDDRFDRGPGRPERQEEHVKVLTPEQIQGKYLEGHPAEISKLPNAEFERSARRPELKKKDELFVAMVKMDAGEHGRPLTAIQESRLDLAVQKHEAGQETFLAKLRLTLEHQKQRIISNPHKYEQAVGLLVGLLGEELAELEPFSASKTVVTVDEKGRVLKGGGEINFDASDLVSGQHALMPTHEMFGGSKLGIENVNLGLGALFDPTVWSDPRIQALPPDQRPNTIRYDTERKEFVPAPGVNQNHPLVKEALVVLANRESVSDFVIPDSVLYHRTSEGTLVIDGAGEVKTITAREMEALIEAARSSKLGNIVSREGGISISLPITNELAYVRVQASREAAGGTKLAENLKFVLGLPSDIPNERAVELAQALAESGNRNIVIQKYDFAREDLVRMARTALVITDFMADLDKSDLLGNESVPRADILGSDGQPMRWKEYGPYMKDLYHRSLTFKTK